MYYFDLTLYGLFRVKYTNSNVAEYASFSNIDDQLQLAFDTTTNTIIIKGTGKQSMISDRTLYEIHKDDLATNSDLHVPTNDSEILFYNILFVMID